MRFGIGATALLVATSLVVTVGGASHPSAKKPSSPTATATATANNPVSPRLQWDANYGYCGETSFVAAGLFYGEYFSQYDARVLASNNANQARESSQLLIGVNDVRAARKMHLAAEPWQPSTLASSSSFLTWIKTHVIEGQPVIIGVYANSSLIDGSTSPTAGSNEYDHIVTVTGVSSHRPLTLPTSARRNDTLTFDDHGLWDGDGATPQLSFTYSFGSFQMDRRQANASNGTVYGLSNQTADYGIAITGVADPAHETLPVHLTTATNAERPVMRDGSTARPRSRAITMTATVSGLTPGENYTLYRYDALDKTPEIAFNAHAGNAAQLWTFTATTTTFSVTQSFASSDQVIYRAVPASGA